MALIISRSTSSRSRAALQVETLAPPHQIGILQRSVKCTKLTTADRLLWVRVWFCTVWQDWQSAVFIIKGSIVIKAAIVLGWHRHVFRLFWTGKIRAWQGRAADGAWTGPHSVLVPFCSACIGSAFSSMGTGSPGMLVRHQFSASSGVQEPAPSQLSSCRAKISARAGHRRARAFRVAGS